MSFGSADDELCGIDLVAIDAVRRYASRFVAVIESRDALVVAHNTATREETDAGQSLSGCCHDNVGVSHSQAAPFSLDRRCVVRMQSLWQVPGWLEGRFLRELPLLAMSGCRGRPQRDSPVLRKGFVYTPTTW